MKRILFLCSCFLLPACIDGGRADFSSENFSLTVTDARSFNPDIVHGKIDHYQITVTAPDLNLPFSQRFGGDADFAAMRAIPTGLDRTITIEAFNPNGLVIRRGRKEGVSVIPGEYSHVEIVMHTVPIFTNVADRGAVSDSRAGFEVFGEPGSKLGIYEMKGEEEGAPLADLGTGRTLVNTEADQGIFLHSPGELPRGLHLFKVEDIDSGESSTVRLTVFQANRRPGLALNAGGKAVGLGDELVFSGVGEVAYRKVREGAENLGGNTLLDIVEVFHEK